MAPSCRQRAKGLALVKAGASLPSNRAGVVFGDACQVYPRKPATDGLSPGFACPTLDRPFCFTRIRLTCAHQGRDEHMRLILILIIAAIAFGVVQGVRHDCQFGLNKATLNCILHRSAATAPTAGEAPAPAPAPSPAPAPTPAAPPQ